MLTVTKYNLTPLANWLIVYWDCTGMLQLLQDVDRRRVRYPVLSPILYLLQYAIDQVLTTYVVSAVNQVSGPLVQVLRGTSTRFRLQ